MSTPDWMAHRRQVLDKARRIVIKVGSGVLTGEHGLDLRVVNRLADQIAALHDKGLDIVLVSSGAVAAGRKVLAGAERPLHGLPDRQAASAIGQSRLMHAYDEAFERYGKISAQVLLTRDDLRSRSRFLNARNTFAALLAWRVIPVVNENDTVAVQELKFGDNDSLAGLVVNLIEGDLIINLTTANGVYDANPLECKDAQCMPCIEDISGLDIQGMCSGKTAEGTGGMYTKLLAARRAAQLGVPTLIVSGKTPFALERAFSGELGGTWIMPDKKVVSRRKFWLAYYQDPQGSIYVDPGAERALARGKSLLAAGITGVEGNFGSGALVRILDHDGHTLGAGLCNYKAAELRNIMGKQSSEIEAILGHCLYPEVIHSDNLLIDAAV